jgi:hypothetical protein
VHESSSGSYLTRNLFTERNDQDKQLSIPTISVRTTAGWQRIRRGGHGDPFSDDFKQMFKYTSSNDGEAPDYCKDITRTSPETMLYNARNLLRSRLVYGCAETERLLL